MPITDKAFRPAKIASTVEPIIGLLVGAVVVTVVRKERWKALPLPAPYASGLTIRPVIGRGVGFAISVTCHTPE